MSRYRIWYIADNVTTKQMEQLVLDVTKFCIIREQHGYKDKFAIYCSDKDIYFPPEFTENGFYRMLLYFFKSLTSPAQNEIEPDITKLSVLYESK